MCRQGTAININFTGSPCQKNINTHLSPIRASRASTEERDEDGGAEVGSWVVRDLGRVKRDKDGGDGDHR